MALDDLPLGLAREPPELLARPFADVAVGEVAVDADGQPVGPGDRQRRLARALELRGVHGGDLGQLVDPRGHHVRLALTLLGQMQARRLAREHLAGRWGLAVADQEDERGTHPPIIDAAQ
jgi:hypothetical protein